MTLTDFLLARIAEDEEGARIRPREWWSDRLEAECEAKRRIVELHTPKWPEFMFCGCGDEPPHAHYSKLVAPKGCGECSEGWTGLVSEALPMMDQKHNQITMREIPVGICETAALLALPYADHPDYREEWRP